MAPFLLGVVAGKLFDNGHFHAIQIFGGATFIFSQVVLADCLSITDLSSVYSCFHLQKLNNIIRQVPCRIIISIVDHSLLQVFLR
jgi:hypothetical protein